MAIDPTISEAVAERYARDTVKQGLVMLNHDNGYDHLIHYRLPELDSNGNLQPTGKWINSRGESKSSITGGSKPQFLEDKAEGAWFIGGTLDEWTKMKRVTEFVNVKVKKNTLSVTDAADALEDLLLPSRTRVNQLYLYGREGESKVKNILQSTYRNDNANLAHLVYRDPEDQSTKIIRMTYKEVQEIANGRTPRIIQRAQDSTGKRTGDNPISCTIRSKPQIY